MHNVGKIKGILVSEMHCGSHCNCLIDIMINLVYRVQINICYLHSEMCSTIHASNAYHILGDNNL